MRLYDAKVPDDSETVQDRGALGVGDAGSHAGQATSPNLRQRIPTICPSSPMH